MSMERYHAISIEKRQIATDDVEQEMLLKISQARTEQYQRVERARMLLHYAHGLGVAKIADALQTTVTKVNRCVDRSRDLWTFLKKFDAHYQPELRIYLDDPG
ncbi:hypothetical protein [Paenibacillus puerhi]|uniref:hypothetical protein n=1 Tax=Paenibacillus puerhi TaxID=2692622 RepID=UPI00135A15D1|nr:hypothetical protein [Paenibacillus puerhi]